MEKFWWGTSCICPECKVDCTLQVVFFAADGQLQFTYWCPKCKEILRWEVYATQLAHQALLNDMKKARKAPLTIQPVQPPLRLKPPLISDQDKEDAHDMGIDWDGE